MSEPINSSSNALTHPAAPLLNRHPLIAKEGWPFIIIGFVAAAVAQKFISPFLAWPLWIFVLFCVQFFRDPRRIPVGNENSVIAPADGRVIVIENTTDPILHNPCIKISVFMNVFNVHSNRSPIDGSIEEVKYFPGNFLNAALDKASESNERNALVLRHKPSNNPVVCIQIAGLVARRILCYVKPKQTLMRGERFGFIRFGSRVDLYLPPNAEVKTMIGQKVKASLDILAVLP